MWWPTSSTPAGRRAAADAVRSACGGRLDGAVLAAGLGPTPGRDQPALITQVNYFGVVELLAGVAARPGRRRTSESCGFFQQFDHDHSGDTRARHPRAAGRRWRQGGADASKLFGRGASSMAYGASKVAVSRWVRRHAVTRDWAGAGIRLNAIAPGAILTPLLEKQLSTPAEAKAIGSFPVPIGGFGDAGKLADWVVFMLSDAADFLCGSVLFVDGGSDAYFRVRRLARFGAGPAAGALPAPVQAIQEFSQ